jgi:molybdenum-dependent DNA-binding transcriptional regulator ModE
MSGIPVLSLIAEPGISFAVRVFSKSLVEQMATRKASKASKGTRKGKRALTPWNKLVMKVYKEMKAKDKNVKFGAALKAASKRKSEM